ncbi:MAG: DUF1415 domain-containing protein [Bacteroidetes bacterium]|nr:DUF1415 domain-containing protein [Bacteroidota bacterium]
MNPLKKPLHYESTLKPVIKWVESMVIGLNLCPFARKEWVGDRVRMMVSEARTPEDLLVDLDEEMSLLLGDSTLATTLLIHPWVLEDFSEYNQFLNVIDTLLQHRGLVGVFQIATFHPQYQFADSKPDDVENATNRSPFPILHILRERSISSAVADYPEPERIPEKNIALLKSMGPEKVQALLKACFEID